MARHVARTLRDRAALPEVMTARGSPDRGVDGSYCVSGIVGLDMPVGGWWHGSRGAERLCTYASDRCDENGCLQRPLLAWSSCSRASSCVPRLLR
jgi:hypothetical protein